jgi:hypothetical protein
MLMLVVLIEMPPDPDFKVTYFIKHPGGIIRSPQS